MVGAPARMSSSRKTFSPPAWGLFLEIPSRDLLGDSEVGFQTRKTLKDVKRAKTCPSLYLYIF